MEFYERPCTTPGFQSYRYRGRYGWVMIGVRDIKDALSEAARSVSDPIEPSRLQRHVEGRGYVGIVERLAELQEKAVNPLTWGCALTDAEDAEAGDIQQALYP